MRGQAEATHTLLTNKGEPRAMGSLTRGESAPENGCWVVAPAPQAWAGPAGMSRLMRSETFVFAQIRHQAGRVEETYQNIKAMWMFLRAERWARGPLARSIDSRLSGSLLSAEAGSQEMGRNHPLITQMDFLGWPRKVILSV